jgi:hypothetical protein
MMHRPILRSVCHCLMMSHFDGTIFPRAAQQAYSQRVHLMGLYRRS